MKILFTSLIKAEMISSFYLVASAAFVFKNEKYKRLRLLIERRKKDKFMAQSRFYVNEKILFWRLIKLI